MRYTVARRLVCDLVFGVQKHPTHQENTTAKGGKNQRTRPCFVALSIPAVEDPAERPGCDRLWG